MPIQLTITGNHSTDLIAEIKTLSEALGLNIGSPFDHDEGLSRAKEFAEKDMVEAGGIDRNPHEYWINKGITAPEEPNENPDIEEAVADEPSTGEEIDEMGLTWDERIHSSNKKKTAKGVWQRKRGIQDMDFNAIVAEIKGQTSEVTPEPVEAEDEEDELLTDAVKSVQENKVEELFGELVEETSVPKEIDHDAIRNLMQEKGRPNGKDNPVMFARMKVAMGRTIPEGTEVKISNIPVNKLKELYYEISAM